uniref:Uncharacterized protein n=1 Tax=Leersia perrieri TaxID=77586 RepID=A0A0D9UWA2_9ORYZ
MMMVPLHASHEVVALLLLEVLLLKPSIAGRSIGWVVEAGVALEARRGAGCSEAMVEADHAIDGASVLLGAIAHLGIGCCRHVDNIGIFLVLLLVVVVLMVISTSSTTAFLAIGVVVLVIEVGSVGILVLDIGHCRSSSLLPEEAKLLAHLVPKKAEIVLIVIVILIIFIIIQFIILRVKLRELVLVVLSTVYKPQG